MAIVIDVLEDMISTPFPGEPSIRTIKYTARDGGGTLYYWIRGGLDPLADLTTLVNGMAQELYDDAAANGTAIPVLITKVFAERKRIGYFLNGWEVLRDEMQDVVTAPLGPVILNHILAKLALNAQAADFFEAMAWRMGLTLTIDTQLTPTVVNALTAANQRVLFQLIMGFMGLGLGVGIMGNFILDDYLNQ